MTPKKILIVDDEPLVCESVKLLLDSDHHETVFASDAMDALTKLDKERFDLVFTDYCMPGIKGDQLAHAIKQKAESTPVIMLTAFPPMTFPEEIDLVLLKPFSLQNLRNALLQVFPASA